MYDMQIEDIDLSEREQAIDLLRFLLCIKRKLEVREVAAYLFFHYTGQHEPIGQEASLRYVKELGGSFIRVTRRSEPPVTTFPDDFAPSAGAAFVQLAHSTVSKYLRHRSQLPDVNGTIANRCLKYLSSTVDAQKCFGMIKRRYGFRFGEDQMEGGVHPEGGLDGRSAREMFLAGWQACRYPCTKFLQDSYPFALYAWSYWRSHLQEAGVVQKEAAIIFERSGLLQCQSLWYGILMLHYWTQRDSYLPAMEYATTLLLCSYIPTWLEGMTRPALSFRESMTAPRGLEETQVKGTDKSHHQFSQRDCHSQQGFMQSRDYNLLVGMIEMLNPRTDIKLYGMKLEELEVYVRRIPSWANPVILLWFCKLLEVRMGLIGSGEYVKMDERFLEEEILDKISQYRPDVTVKALIKATENLRDLKTEDAHFAYGVQLLTNSCGFRLPHIEGLVIGSEKIDRQSAINEAEQVLLGDVKVDEENVRIADEAMRALFIEEEEQWLEDALQKAWPQPITGGANSQDTMPALRQRIVTKRGPEDDRIITGKAIQERGGTLWGVYKSTIREARRAKATSEATTAPQQTADPAGVGEVTSQLEKLEVEDPANAQQGSSQSDNIEKDSDMNKWTGSGY